MTTTPRALPAPTASIHTKIPLSWRMPEAAGGYTLRGYSRAADATAFEIPELGCVFDAGLLIHGQRPDRVFVTHTHTDHAHMLTHIKSRRKPPLIVLPEHATGLLEDYFRANQALTDNAPFDPERAWTTPCTLRGVEPGETLTFTKGQRAFRVEVLGCVHSVPCLGYRFVEVRQKLKAEYQGLPGAEIGRLRREGAAITEAREIPRFALLGDTTPEVFARHPELLETPLVITECSFLDGEAHAPMAAKTQHTLWADLEPYIDAAPEVTFVLTHFSWRYGVEEVLAFFEARGRRNVIPWISASASG